VIKEPALHYAPGKVRHIVIGDSHSHSAYKAGSMMLRKDGRTLNGILKKTIKREIEEYGYDLNDIDSLTCYWGNIDIRHHLCREADPKAALKDLLKRYEDELKSLNKQIELVTPLPIESEERKIPKSGFYKGTPFIGTREQRQELVSIFKDVQREMAQRNGWTLFEWPEAWYSMDGTIYMSTYMERPRSVHLARKFYRWDLVNNVENPLMTELRAIKPKNLLEF
jgi:DNA-directed RNA polymerase subunit L